MKKYSIVIPTYNHCEDLLKPCIESILQYTDHNLIEIIVVANGCTDGTREFLENLDSPVSFIWYDEPLGYTYPTNIGMKQATGDYVILLNNDIVLLDQEKNKWLNVLEEPFLQNKNTGISGPVKFSWNCGGKIREAMAFWCVMIHRKVIDKIGYLDEIFSPGMGEDGDYSIRAVEAGFNLVSVPEDITGEFETGIKNFNFPIWHKGNGTFADQNDFKNEIIERNTKILAQRYGIKSNVGLWKWYEGMTEPIAYGDDTTYKLGAEFLYDCKTIEDWGCGTAYFSNFMHSKQYYKGIDGSHSNFVSEIHDLTTYVSLEKPDGILMRHILEHNHDWKSILQNALLSFEKKFVLVLFTPLTTSPTKVIVENVEPPVPDISFCLYDILEFLKPYKFNVEEVRTNTQYGVEYIFYIEKQTKPIDITIVVPTYNHLNDALKKCIEKLFQFTHMFNKEIIVVSNGSTDGTKEYLESLTDKLRYIFIQEPIGYIRAVNWGIASSNSKYTVLIDNDSFLMDQQMDQWIHILQKPFLDYSNVGATSPFATWYEELGTVLHSGCTMYDTQRLKQVGMFDEIYNPGYLSDSDVSMKLVKAGYQCLEVPESNLDKQYEKGIFRINFPVMHLGDVQTMDKSKDVEIIKKNREILYNRYGKKNMQIKYSIVIPTYNHCDDLLIPCVDSILQYTDMSNVEIIVVANGCTDNTADYVHSLGEKVKLIWSDEALGYTKATNLGIKATKGEFIVLLNNDTMLLHQEKNLWLNMLENKLKEPEMGLTGPLQLYDHYANAPVIIFFCVMIKKEVFEKIGLLDEIFSPGGGEDIDFTVRARQAGYKVEPLVSTKYNGETNVGDFPIWHKNNRTFVEMPEYTNYIVKRNGLINCKRYNKNIKLNLGSGGIDYPGYLSVDLYDKRANILMDITKLDFDDNSVSELLASHVFEHLNPYHVQRILSDWNRILKPSGKLIMEMPDIEALCARFANANMQERYGILNAIYGSVNTTDSGGPDEITSPHLFGWWKDSLYDFLSHTGYEGIEFMNEKIPHPESNLRVEAYKPPVPTKNVEQKDETVKTIVDRNKLRLQDPYTYKEIFEDNSYMLSENEIKDKIVFDLGANIGLFALRCLELGAKAVLCVEAQPTVFNFGLKPNTEEFKKILTLNNAVYNVDGRTVTIDNQNVASSVGKPGDEVKTISLNTLIQHITEDVFLKIDIEGSEFEVLRAVSIQNLRKAFIVVMEIHTSPGKEVNEIHHIMTNAGFELIHQQTMRGGLTEEEREWKPLNVSLEKWRRINV